MIAVVAFALATIYALPNLALMFGIGLVMIRTYISLFFCFIFAWNIAKLVESGYRRFRNEDSKKCEVECESTDGSSEETNSKT